MGAVRCRLQGAIWRGTWGATMQSHTTHPRPVPPWTGYVFTTENSTLGYLQHQNKIKSIEQDNTKKIVEKNMLYYILHEENEKPNKRESTNTKT